MRESNEQIIADVLKAFVQKYKHRPKLMEARINKIWKARMGKSIVQLTSSIRVRNRTLVITVDSASLKSEFSYQKEKIIDFVNKQLGEPYIQRIMIY